MKLVMRFVAILLLFLLALATSNIRFCKGISYMGCIGSEKQALLRFKRDLTDSYNRLASWTSDGDCCTWAGVVCDNFTGHVTELNLRNTAFRIYRPNYRLPAESDFEIGLPLFGEINPSLLDLNHLIHLDLSHNSFQGTQIPGFLGSMGSLRYLNISGAGFFGMVPHQLGNLSNLQYLDLSQNYLYVESFSWLSSLSLLNHLDISGVNLSQVSDWLVIANSLPYLVELRVSGCQLQNFPPLQSTNFSFLTTLDLSQNQFDNSWIPSWIFSLHHLLLLDLNRNNIQGPIPNGLQNLTSLRSLDLSFNFFNSTIPNWLSRLSFLEYLSLATNNLQGMISSALGNLTSIKTLDLSSNDFEGRIAKSLGRLCKLKSISISGVHGSQNISELLDIFSICASDGLESLDFSDNKFFGHLTNQLGQFKNLVTLDLSRNNLSGLIPTSLRKLSLLSFLDLSYNKLDGPIPSFLGKLSLLISLDLSDNMLNGTIPSSVGKLLALRFLYLSNNKLRGSIPLSLGNLSSLKILEMSDNQLNGTLSQMHVANLTNLIQFSVSGNSLFLEVKSNWTFPSQLQRLGLGSCYLGPQFPSWLHSPKDLCDLDISNSGISDTIPRMFWKSLSQFYSLNISHNQIHGQISDLTGAASDLSLDLSSNNLSGPLPLTSLDVFALDLSNNALSGSIFHFICDGMNKSKRLYVLKLSGNLLSRDLPDCWMNLPNLVILNLGNNKFTGNLPATMGTLSFLGSLNLRNNNLSGIIPVSLKNCTNLMVFDISENEFTGNVPTWIGESFSRMVILNLRSNKFHGLFPVELCRLNSLQVLDLAYNNLSGTIPRCINNFTVMVFTMNYMEDNAILFSNGQINSFEDALLVMKGRMTEYSTILNLVRIIDFSKNKFSGKIPTEMTNLGALQSLNLSHNSFTGRIPQNIGAMKSLESLDLSENQLFGEIPYSITSLTFLSSLNFSSNNLTGKIPSSTQLQSFDASCFAGNYKLCGPPLPTCIDEANTTSDFGSGRRKAGNEHEVDIWFYLSMALGFVVGFWSLIGPLVFNRRWRYRYCHFLDCLGQIFDCVLKIC